LGDLAIRYALVGLVVIFIRGIVTERITAVLIGRQATSTTAAQAAD
jgi:PTS system glucitol/sorbitol-specific IIC component